MGLRTIGGGVNDYRSRRVGGRVVIEYVGSGEVVRMAHEPAKRTVRPRIAADPGSFWKPPKASRIAAGPRLHRLAVPFRVAGWWRAFAKARIVKSSVPS